MTTSIVEDQEVLEKQIKKQMGCMAGFLQIFDRQQILSGKRLYTKRLPPSTCVESEPESTPAEQQTPETLESTTPTPTPTPTPTTTTTNANTTNTTKLSPLPVFDFKEGARSPWKFSKEAPRLSLDSRAIIDAKGVLKPREIPTINTNHDDDHKDRRSPSVIARLMGLEPSSDPQPAVIQSQLRRSASESRVNRDLVQSQYRFIDGLNFQMKQTPSLLDTNVIIREDKKKITSTSTSVGNRGRGEPAKNANKGGIGVRKSFFDSADFFPEPTKHTVSIYGEIEKRLKMRGIDEPSKDLETLKHILEALQLKGLLHSRKNPNHHNRQINNRNFVYDYDESPIVVMKPARSINRPSRIGTDSAGSRPAGLVRRNHTENLSPRRERNQSQVKGRGSLSPTRNEPSVQSPSRRRAMNVESQRKVTGSMNECYEQRRSSPVQSPRVSPRRTGSDQALNNRSPRVKKPTVEIYHNPEDEFSSISESSISSSSHTDNEGRKVGGRSLLERCDKLLNSIAEITTSTELQPSPVSVLDSSFYKEESSPSPIMKRSIEFKDHAVEFDDDQWSPSAISLVQLKSIGNSDDCDFIYISDILRASNSFPADADVFLLLEKQQYLKGNDMSKTSMRNRKLIFDIINEILNRKKQLLPLKTSSWNNCDSLQHVWSEYKKIKERDTSEDLFEVICGVLRKDLAGDSLTGWSDCPIEISEAVLDIERLIFKDLIGETIRDLAGIAGKSSEISVFRRKLVF
ncbi:hypothetical protein ACFE04_011678 [Oxalis oulophora]